MTSEGIAPRIDTLGIRNLLRLCTRAAGVLPWGLSTLDGYWVIPAFGGARPERVHRHLSAAKRTPRADRMEQRGYLCMRQCADRPLRRHRQAAPLYISMMF